MTAQYPMDIDGLDVLVEADLIEASAGVYLTLRTGIATRDQRRICIGQTADARHRESGLAAMARQHLVTEGVLLDAEG